jgi:hypothetical protein
MLDEKVFYEKNNVKITESRAIINNWTYPMNNISSVSTSEILKRPFLLYFFGGILVIVGAVMVISEEIGFAFIFALIGAIIIFIGTKFKSKYSVRIGSSGGENYVLTNEKKGFIDEIVNSLNEAIIAKNR